MSQATQRSKRELVPGRKIIDDEHMLHVAGIHYDASYLNESSMHSVADDSVCSMDSSQIRIWKKQGLAHQDIYRRLQENECKKHDEAKKRLKAQMNGAKTFDELLEQSDAKNRKRRESVEQASKEKFAVPDLPMKTMHPNAFLSPNRPSSSTSVVNGRPGMSCSTPKNGANTTFRPLRQLNLSQVVNTETLSSNKHNVKDISVIVPIASLVSASSSKKTANHCVPEKDDSDTPLQGTFVIENGDKNESSEKSKLGNNATVNRSKNDSAKDKPASLQGTFTIEKDVVLQETFTIDKNISNTLERPTVVHKDANNDSQNATITENDNATFVVPSNDTIIIEKRAPKKTTIEEREKRNMSFSFGTTPSPGSNSFRHRRKQMRPSIATAQKPVANPDRLSTGSEKERTIAMLSINEVPESEISGSSFTSSYVDAVSVNHVSDIQDVSSHSKGISPIPEVEENEKRPKSRAQNAIETQTEPKMLERIRDAEITIGQVSVAVATSFDNTPAAKKPENTRKSVAAAVQTTPYRRYAMPTIASISKSINGKTPVIPIAKGTPLADRFTLFEDDDDVEARNRRTQNQESSSNQSETVVDQRSNSTMHTEVPEKSTFAAPAVEPEVQEIDAVMEDAENSESEEVDQNASASRSIAQSLRGLTMDSPVGQEMDEGDEEQEKEEQPESSNTTRTNTSRTRARLNSSPDSLPRINRNRRRVVLDDSMDESRGDSGNYQPGNDDDDEDMDDSFDQPRRSNRRNKKEVDGLLLAKRKIIKPEDNPDGLRRSTRTRCKPLRTWLGEQAIYESSPSGGKRLKGVTSVVVTDKRFIRYRTADPRLATERQLQERAMKQARAAQRRRDLAEQHKRGFNLDTTQEDIVTSDDD